MGIFAGAKPLACWDLTLHSSASAFSPNRPPRLMSASAEPLTRQRQLQVRNAGRQVFGYSSLGLETGLFLLYPERLITRTGSQTWLSEIQVFCYAQQCFDSFAASNQWRKQYKIAFNLAFYAFRNGLHTAASARHIHTPGSPPCSCL